MRDRTHRPGGACRAIATCIVLLLLSACGEPDAAPPPPSWARLAPEQLDAAQKLSIPPAFTNRIGMRFVLVPPGTFSMGSPNTEEGREADELLHNVEIREPYYLQVTEVTNAQYRRWRPEHSSGAYDGHSLNGDRQPAVPLSWDDAVGFASWVAESDEEYSYRLPTEAEWEYACRAGTRGKLALERTAVPRHANFSDVNDPTGEMEDDLDDGYAVTAPVGSYAPNPWGIFDMHGNVWEWTLDWYGRYEIGSVLIDPTGPPTGKVRVRRGGSWRSPLSMLRCAYRRRYTPDPDLLDNGCRLVAVRRR